MVFVRYPFPCDFKCLDYEDNHVLAGVIKDDIESFLGYNQFSLLYNGKQLHDVEVIPNNSTVQVAFSLPGGKGGFGSMLRAIGAQIEKTTNREACRDLSGRRLRDINEEQRLKKWIAKEAEREAEKIKRRQARIERLKSKAPHKFFDYDYEKEISELPTRINDALNEGLQKAKQPCKRPLEKTEIPKKSWLSDDLPISSSDSESDESNSNSGDSPSKRPKIAPKGVLNYDSALSESSQPHPGSSKDQDFTFEGNSTSCDSKAPKAEGSEGYSTDSNSIDFKNTKQASTEVEQDVQQAGINVMQTSETTVTQSEECNGKYSEKEVIEIQESAEKDSTVLAEPKEVQRSNKKDSTVSSDPDKATLASKPDAKDDSHIDLLEFENVSELEALGLDRLKSALMVRGLKCGGTLTDRAQRLWKVRSLQPHEYPSNLLAKNKK